MLALAKQLGIAITPVETEDFSISAVSGHSVCSGGNFSVEARIRGVSLSEAADVMRMLGNVVYSPEMGVVLIKSRSCTVKFFASGNLKVTAADRKVADRMYRNACLQLLRIARCSGCGVCLNACTRGSIELKNGKIKIHDSCTGCGKCNESCVVVRYANRIIPDI
jgi:phosphoadenosine phosphosulfate reductase